MLIVNDSGSGIQISQATRMVLITHIVLVIINQVTVFPGFSGGDDILYFAIPHTETGPFNGYSNATVDYFMMTTIYL